MRELKFVGRPEERLDALEKVTGKALFADDLFFPGMLYGRVLYSSHPHARIISINTLKAQSIPGVRAILTGFDVPGRKQIGMVIPDQFVLCTERVRYLGDGVALVAADSREIAEEAIRAIEVKYDPLPAVFSPAESLTEGAPVIHAERPDNIVCRHILQKGNIEDGLRVADLILERTYNTPFIEHAYLEPECAVAVPEPGRKGVHLLGSIQNPFNTRKMVGEALNLPLDCVRITPCALGGSFGGKDEVMYLMCIRAALLALCTGHAVKITNSREDSLRESYKRHPYQMHYKVGTNKEGRLLAMEIKILADAGAYASQSPFVTWRSLVHATGAYEIPHVKAEVLAVYTNNTYTGAMRGFGNPQVSFAAESLMDEIAFELGISPVEIRKKNLLRQGSLTATGQILDQHMVSATQVMERVLELIGWQEKNDGFSADAKRRGIGFAVGFRGCSLGAEGIDRAEAKVRVLPDGRIQVLTGLLDNGGGLRTVLAQIAAEELGVPLSWVEVSVADTTQVPDAGPAVASRSTMMGGNAVREAAFNLSNTLLAQASKLCGLPPYDLKIENGRFISLSDGRKRLSFGEVLRAALKQGIILEASGVFQAPEVDWNPESGQGKAYFTYVYSSQAAEVEVDVETGQVKVLKVGAAHDLGRAINPATARGQVAGGVMMGLGYGLLEEVEMQKGETRTLNFDTYTVPTSCDTPKIIPLLVENPDPFGPYGAKSLGEPTNDLTAAAIANAIFRACGVRIRSLPCSLERIRLGHSLEKGIRGSELAFKI